MTGASDSFTLLDESVALLKRSRGARSRQLARQTVRGALKAVVREVGQIGDHHVRALADDLEGAWRSYEYVKDGDVRNALGQLVGVSSSLASLRVAMNAGRVESVVLVVRGCDDEEILRTEIAGNRIPEQYRGKGGLELIGHDGQTTVRRSRSKTWTLRFPELHAGQMEIWRGSVAADRPGHRAPVGEDLVAAVHRARRRSPRRGLVVGRAELPHRR